MPIHRCLSGHTFLILMGWTCLAQAQGQASYGGIAGDIVGVVLIVILIAATLVLLAVKSFFGRRAAFGVLAILVLGFIYLRIDAQHGVANQAAAYREIELVLAKGCTETTRVIAQRAGGDEHIFLRLQGADQLTENQRLELLPLREQLGEGVEIVTDVPADATNAIVVDIRFSRDPLPGSHPPYDWRRSKYEVNALTFPGGLVVARTVDMEARNGFCLNNLELFLRTALNRPAVLRGHYSYFDSKMVPDAYVQANYVGTSNGVFQKSPVIRDTAQEISALFGKQGCPIKEKSSMAPVALCGDPAMPVEVGLHNILGIYQLADSWLLVYRLDKGMRQLTSMRVEQRSTDWRLMRSWHASLIPAASILEGAERLDEFAMDGDAMTIATYWGFKHGTGRGLPAYTYRSVLTVPLPGVVK